jgi:biotin carboxyl carrier protein
MTAPMPGKILEVKVADGQTVEAGELLLVMEAMKMEHRIVAPTDGVVTKVNFSMGDQVQQGDVLVEMGE